MVFDGSSLDEVKIKFGLQQRESKIFIVWWNSYKSINSITIYERDKNQYIPYNKSIDTLVG